MMTTSYRQTLDADRRSVILGLLDKATGYKLSDYLMQSALPAFGHDVSIDVVRTDLAWLQEQGLITVETPGAVQIAKLTQRGLDVAAGRAVVPGVKRPGPEQ